MLTPCVSPSIMHLARCLEKGKVLHARVTSIVTSLIACSARALSVDCQGLHHSTKHSGAAVARLRIGLIAMPGALGLLHPVSPAFALGPARAPRACWSRRPPHPIPLMPHLLHARQNLLDSFVF